MLSKSEVIDILQLISSENLGPATFYKLVKEFGSAKVAINNAHKLKKIRLLGRERAEELYKRLHNFGAKIITVYDEEYPNTLHAMNDMAPILFALGNIELLKAEKADMEAEMLKRNINIFKRKLRGIIEAQLEMVDDIEKIEM